MHTCGSHRYFSSRLYLPSSIRLILAHPLWVQLNGKSEIIKVVKFVELSCKKPELL